MNLKSAWLHFQQLQALPAFRLSPRWQEQVNHNLWWACLPDLITPVIPSRYTVFYVWDRKQQWEEQRLFPCAVLSPSSHQPWNMRIHTFTHTQCVYMRDRELENTLGTAACSWSTTVWANAPFPAPSNGLVLRQRQQTCNFSFLFIRAQKAIQVLSMWCSLAPWGSAKHGKPRWKLSGTVRLVPLEGIPNFQGDSPIPPGAHC